MPMSENSKNRHLPSEDAHGSVKEKLVDGFSINGHRTITKANNTEIFNHHIAYHSDYTNIA